MKIKIILVLFCVLSFLSFSVSDLKAGQSTPKKPPIGIEEQLGATLPLNLKFVNSNGDTFKLSQLIDRPTILSFAYYHCPGLCSTLLTSLRDAVDKVKLEPGVDFRIITISIDHNEKLETAVKWAKSYVHLQGSNRVLPDDAWYFLVGDSVSIRTLTDAVGYYFIPDGRSDFTHPTAIMAISPKGVITRYLFGTEFSPFDLKMSLIEANAGKPMPTINRVLNFCFSYDPDSHRYAFQILRVIGVVMLFFVGVFVSILLIKKQKSKTKAS